MKCYILALLTLACGTSTSPDAGHLVGVDCATASGFIATCCEANVPLLDCKEVTCPNGQGDEQALVICP